MIDIESQLFTRIANALRGEFQGIFVSSEYVRRPSSFPAVFIVERENTVNRAGRDSGSVENFADVMYQVDVYSNKNKGAKAEARAIAGFIDAQFAEMGFTRSFLNQIPNMDDATIYRMTGRWAATVSRDEVIYRR